jgi:hypothetical protein
MSSPGQSTSSFHSRKHKQLHAKLKESIRAGIAITGNVSKELLEKLAAEVRAERRDK